MLWFEGRVWVIDVSQSVTPNHPEGLEFLLRDCGNVVNFFKGKKGVKTLTTEALFTAVSGLELDEEIDILSQIRRYQKTAHLREMDEDEMEKASPIPIPGPPSASSSSGRNRISKSPKTSTSKSPKSPKSPFLSMTDEELRKMKEALLTSKEEDIKPHEASQVKFDVE